jgi:hypothetical protein
LHGILFPLVDSSTRLPWITEYRNALELEADHKVSPKPTSTSTISDSSSWMWEVRDQKGGNGLPALVSSVPFYFDSTTIMLRFGAEAAVVGDQSLMVENVTSILFLVSLADYNACIIEDRSQSAWCHPFSLLLD